MSGQAPMDTFLDLSCVLTGENRLSPVLASEYYRRINEAFGVRLEALLNEFASLQATEADVTTVVAKRIMPDDQLGLVAREIIMLWYLAGFRGPDSSGGQREYGPETAEQYFQGLLWPAIHAHPLGLSGGYFGYWHYPPEN